MVYVIFQLDSAQTITRNKQNFPHLPVSFCKYFMYKDLGCKNQYVGRLLKDGEAAEVALLVLLKTALFLQYRMELDGKSRFLCVAVHFVSG